MALGSFKRIKELQDEDKWGYKWLRFTKTELIWIFSAACIGYFVYHISKLIHLELIGIFFGIGLVLVATYIAKVTVSESQYLRGGGYPLRKIVIIRMQRRFSRMIYAKNYDKLKNR